MPVLWRDPDYGLAQQREGRSIRRKPRGAPSCSTSRAVIIRLGKAFELLDHGSQISCIRDNRIIAARTRRDQLSVVAGPQTAKRAYAPPSGSAFRFAYQQSSRPEFPFLSNPPPWGMAWRELWLGGVALRHLARQRRLECECLARRELWRRLMFHDSAHRARTVSQSVQRAAQTMMRYASQSGIGAAPDMVRPSPVKRAEPAAGFAARLACSFGKILRRQCLQ